MDFDLGDVSECAGRAIELLEPVQVLQRLFELRNCGATGFGRCELYDANRRASVVTVAYGAVFYYLLTKHRQSSLRRVGGKTVPNPECVSLPEPLSKNSAFTLGDRIAAPVSGWGGERLSSVLHAERLDQARRAWEAKPPSVRAESTEIAAEAGAVFGFPSC